MIIFEVDCDILNNYCTTGLLYIYIYIYIYIYMHVFIYIYIYASYVAIIWRVLDIVIQVYMYLDELKVHVQNVVILTDLVTYSHLVIAMYFSVSLYLDI